jgi:hypothetical protein
MTFQHILLARGEHQPLDLGREAPSVRQSVVQLLDAQNRSHERHQRRLVHGLGQYLFQASHHILGVGPRRDQDDRDERKAVVGLSRRQTSSPSIFGIMMREERRPAAFREHTPAPPRHRPP